MPLLAEAERVQGGGFFFPALTSPTFSSTWLMTSVAEWIVSANSVGEPIVTNPKNFEPVMRLLVAIDMVTDFDTRLVSPPAPSSLSRMRRRPQSGQS